MQLIIAPSKTMNMSRLYPHAVPVSSPHFLKEATAIVGAICQMDDIANFMHVSQPIADRVTDMYKHWGNEKAPAIFAYVGDVYKGFFADTLSADDLLWAQGHMLIMSGLYGALRPMDEISPYRLEMKAKLHLKNSNSLYAVWGDKIADFTDMQSDEVICNLSSDEYAKVVTKYTKKRVVTPVFLDDKVNGTLGTVPIYSKMMRGVLARWIIDHRIDTPDGLHEFSSQGYVFDKAKSAPNQPVFYRTTPKPIRF